MVWPIPILINMFTALKRSRFLFLFIHFPKCEYLVTVNSHVSFPFTVYFFNFDKLVITKDDMQNYHLLSTVTFTNNFLL